ncbi:MAG: Response regulator/GGDEF domain protein [Gemmatimonadetes bacterium]|nr:Response regulator/GGDEF domain protein [Gemmatimonadota bacterium]
MLRRTDDRTMKLVLAAPAEWQDRTPEFLESWAEDATRRVRRLPADETPLLLVAELSAGEPARVLAHPDGDAAAARLAGIDPASWREEALRTRKRRELPDKLLAFFEELNRADGEGEVYRALATHAVRIVGAYRAQVLLPDPAEPGVLRAVAGTTGADPEVRVPRTVRLERPGLTCATDVRAAGGGPLSALAPLVSERSTCTATLAHVPVGDGGVLVLTERRDDRVFEAEDWDMLRALALQGEMTLKRVRLLEDVRGLALTDPLTGLANRRHMEVVLACAWGAAQRGDPLAVIVMDLDGFKAVNDERGHLAGDALLQAVAAALRAEARGADTVVRYGGDEFLAILPGGGEEGAGALLARVRERLAGRVQFSAGVAVHGPHHASADALIRDADRALYEGKRARGGAAGR